MQRTDHLTEAQLNEYLDNALKDRANIELHLSSCADCATRLAAMQALFTEIESLPELDLSRDLAGTVVQKLGRSNGIPRWLTLTAALQAGAALIAMAVAAPHAIQFLSSSMPVWQPLSFAGIFFQLQSQWTAWLDLLSQIHMPSLPHLPALETSGLFLMISVTGISILWLAGNGLLLRNQIK